MDENLLELTAHLVSAYVTNNHVASSELPRLIDLTYAQLSGLADSGAARAPEPVVELKPAVPVKKSVTPDYIVSLEDGRKFKSLKRHLSAHYGLTPEQYRAKWNLPADYPMVAPNYTARRSELARAIGLGRKAVVKAPAPVVKRGRRKAAAAPTGA